MLLIMNLQDEKFLNICLESASITNMTLEFAIFYQYQSYQYLADASDGSLPS